MKLLKTKIKEVFAPVLYKHISSGLQPERLYFYLDSLWNNKSVEGSILEIGCNLCGTSILAKKMLVKLGIEKPYICIDTFGGFIEDQFENDAKKYNVPPANKYFFDANSVKLVKRILKMHGREDIQLIKGDIVNFDMGSLQTSISVCLLDVDLEIPVYEGINKVYPSLSKGGIILVDDCPEGTNWGGARKGYERYMKEIDKSPEYKFGFGILRC